MPKKYQLQILWTVRCDPISIIEMLNDERITALIASDHFICRIGSWVNKHIGGLSDVVISPTEPHGKISDIYKEDDIGWYGDVCVSEKWTDLIDCMEDPILHPLIIGSTSSKEFKIVHFAIMDRTEVDRNRTYDGIHYDNSEDVTTPMKLFRIEISDDQNHYEHFGISIIVKAENINHAYMKFWENIINDKHIDFSDCEADPLFENDHFSNWVIDSYDDKHITYKRPGKNFKIRVEELDLSKGYALVGDWST